MTIMNSKLENRQLGGYKLNSLIGRGGMAEVWLATQLNLNRPVAVKVISETVSYEDDQQHLIERFRREAQAVARLDHPAILPIIDYGQAEGYLYMVTPFVPGGSLLQRLQRETLPRRVALNIFQQVLDGLTFAHHHHIIHRDLKPGNILLYSAERAVIADFGVAKIETDNLALTTDGMVLGSPEYMAPEQFMGLAEYRSDLYSLGVLLYQLLTGRVPYTGTSAWQIGVRHLNEPLPLPHPLIPPTLEAFLAQTLQKRPEDRFSNADQMNQAFQAAVAALNTHELQVQPASGQPSTPFSGKIVQNKITESLRATAVAPVSAPATSPLNGPKPPVGPAPVSAETTGSILPSLGLNGVSNSPRPKTRFPVGLAVGTGLLLLAAVALAVLFVVLASRPNTPFKQSPIASATSGTGPSATKTVVTSPTQPTRPAGGAVVPVAPVTTAARVTTATTAPASTTTTASTLKVSLNPANGTAARGQAELTDNGNGTITVVINMSGLGQGAHNVHIHQGSCAKEGVLKYELEPLQAKADGTASASSTVKTGLADLGNGNFYFDVTNYTDDVVYAASCGDIRTG